jgi:SAM-dependent methyltransferase
VYAAVRRDTYDEDLGQTSWITGEEACEHFRSLAVGPGAQVLEVACGSGGVACSLATRTGASCVGIDVNAAAVEAATARARALGLASQVSFRQLDASLPLPFDAATFDAILCNDSINHLAGRPQVLREWRRVLRTGGRLLFTVPVFVTGQLSNEEIRVRSSIGFFLFTPLGCNERLLAEAGFAVAAVRDLTGAVAAVSRRWREARERRREQLVALEGEAAVTGLRDFLLAVETLAAERRLSRFVYFATAA